MPAILRGGPGDSQSVTATGPLLVWRSCLYEVTPDWALRRGSDRRVYQHRPDCCEPFGRGSEDRCE
ncbi:hypothetical protein ACI2K4_04405 [Micromonospora sp. NPDC050397]|uniref:hypothetical protein n=1 Tax=Micromonospora sp. NPDC050397 TaxID=3364279 RepID=UPI00385043A2